MNTIDDSFVGVFWELKMLLKSICHSFENIKFIPYLHAVIMVLTVHINVTMSDIIIKI